jgi:succinate dehydrogenase / fumarate reductase cytochrome b subunit
VLGFYRSTVGKKVIMAVTGLIGVGFVIVHMMGNLQVFVGAQRIDAYGHLLHGPLAEVTWALRGVLLVAVALHVLMAWQLTQRAKAARPVAYMNREPQVTTLASRMMRWGGVLLLIFIVVHLLHFTSQTIDPAGWRGKTDADGYNDIYGNVVASFHIWWVSAFYVIAMIALGLHLYHGAWSSVRTLGYAKRSNHPLKRNVALLVALIVWAGFTLLPVAVLSGVLK